MGNILEQLDAQLASLLYDWSFSTTLIALIIAAFVAYPIFYPSEPDTHPLLLARQSAIGSVRNKNESAVYRSPEVPADTPLRSGLGVKDASAPRWSAGKDGDLRDVWREVMKGGKNDVAKGSIMTVLGKEELVEHDVEQLNQEIAVMGKHMKEAGVKKVAVYLPNCAEYLMTVFACSFYGLTPVLLPYNLPHPKIIELLKSTSADGLICAAGNLPLEDVAEQCQNLRLLTWVVEKTSRHMDWNGVPSFAEKRLQVSVWHDVVEENTSTAPQLPSNDDVPTPADITIVQQNLIDLSQPPQTTTFTHRNLASATAALISALPSRQRLNAADLVLPASSFSVPYVLCQTLATLYTHASLAITSVAEPGVDLALATRGVAPTVVIASAETLAKLHAQENETAKGLLHSLAKYTSTQSLASGRMPDGNSLLFRLLSPSKTASQPGKLRLILTSERLGGGSPPLSAAMLSDLRIFTRARICYALTSPFVAGAVAQTHVFDYRVREGQAGSRYSHFGLPLSSVEIKLVNKEDREVEGTGPRGEIVVKGPAVAGEGKEAEVNIGVGGRFGVDGCLELV
ncbi:uncharacterized protein LTR77_008012 [Saxophila tyrrhenica]|uniref:AMP-dependent synthetase/ligase domain-containing protein n=1 Tax=Saxophila tyrrhenica TaxID=1690608 RepID=A0AAV9P5H3_9PEZI|nr:hypothetical protein LTR77_008012 [Saxophila tyrrhenica]